MTSISMWHNLGFWKFKKNNVTKKIEGIKNEGDEFYDHEWGTMARAKHNAVPDTFEHVLNMVANYSPVNQ